MCVRIGLIWYRYRSLVVVVVVAAVNGPSLHPGKRAKSGSREPLGQSQRRILLYFLLPFLKDNLPDLLFSFLFAIFSACFSTLLSIASFSPSIACGAL